MEQNAGQISALIVSYGLTIIAALVILIIGWIGAGWISRAVARGLETTGKVDVTLRRFFASLVRYFVLAFTVLDRVPAGGVRALRSTRLPAGRAGTFRLPRWAA